MKTILNSLFIIAMTVVAIIGFMTPNVFAICTIDGNQFVTYSCKKCYNEIKELEHEIILKEEFEKYLS